MQLLAEIPQMFDEAPFHREVDILSLKAGSEVCSCRLGPDGLQTLNEAAGLLRSDHTVVAQHAGMGDGAVQILLEQGQVKANRGIEPLDGGMESLLKAVAPAGRRATRDARGLGTDRSVGHHGKA